MSDELSSLMAELGATQEETPATPETTADDNSTNESTTPETTATDTGTDTNTDAATENDNTNEPDNVVQTEQEQSSNRAFAAMRADNTKYKKFINRLMTGSNFQGSEEDFINQLTEASYAQEAKTRGNQVNPEFLKEQYKLKQEVEDLKEARSRELFYANAKNLKDTLRLNESDLKEFMDYAVKEHIDLTAPGVNFVTLYKGLFHDKLVARSIEEARQNWIAQSNKASTATNPDGKSGTQDPSPLNVNTAAELDSLLKNLQVNK